VDDAGAPFPDDFAAARRLRQRSVWRARLRSAAAATILAAGGVACSKGSANLAGHWKGQRSEGVDPAIVESANAFATHMRVDVKGDTLTLTTPKETRTDHYVVVQEDKTKTVIATDLDGAGDPQTFLFADGKTMRWAVGPTATVVFTKE